MTASWCGSDVDRAMCAKFPLCGRGFVPSITTHREMPSLAGAEAMEQDRNTFELTDLESLATSGPGEAPETLEPEADADVDASRTMRIYARAMNRYPLLARDKEQALAAEIEELSRALWTAVLSEPATAGQVAALVAERLPAARSALRKVERAVPAGSARRHPEARRALARAAARASAKLHELDVDHLVVDEIARFIAAAAREPARAPAVFRARAGSKTFARYAGAVADAAHAVADARTRFVQANIGLVFFVAGRYRSTSLSLADFVQEGMFGLMKAVDRFNYRRGLRFSTYATWWIRHAMGRALSDKSRLVRVPVHLQEARQRLGAVERILRRELGREPTGDELAQAAGVSRDRLEHIQEVNSPLEIRLDAPTGEDEDRPRSELFVHPSEPASDPSESLDRESLARAIERHMQGLSPMEQEVVRRRFALGGVSREATLQEIADDHGLSRERIRQIQAAALRKLRAGLEADELPGERAA
jgi:RNA polymerase primary sigma factor